jgi:hypothetical protein
LVKTDKDYRCYYESSVPSGKIPSAGRWGIYDLVDNDRIFHLELILF